MVVFHSRVVRDNATRLPLRRLPSRGSLRVDDMAEDCVDRVTLLLIVFVGAVIVGLVASVY
jgi:hypothetical protein